MIRAKDAVFWVNFDTKEVMVRPHSWRCPEDHPEVANARGYWVDPIGAAYSGWLEATKQQRVQLMLETAIDLAMQGIPLKTVLTTFAEVDEFRALGNQSYPMCRAMTAALVGKSLEPNTIPFEELLAHYSKQEV